jgi:hypothetical protein
MTAVEMREEFKILYDKITSFSAPGYNEEEISILLTKAQERVIYDLYHPLGNKYREGFEETEARRKDLKELVLGTTISTPATTQTNVLPNGTFYDLPTNCLYLISEEVTISSNDSCLNGSRIRVKPITHDEYSINKHNPFKKPYKDLVWRLDYSNKVHELITDGTYTISQYHIRYIKRPEPIITDASVTIEGIIGPNDCELDGSIHRRIIDEAVKIAVGITTPEEYQLKLAEQKEAEQ